MSTVAPRRRSIVDACIKALAQIADADLRRLAEAVVAEIRRRSAVARADRPQHVAAGAILVLGIAEARPRPSALEVAQIAFLALDDHSRAAFVAWAEKVQP